MVRIWRSLCSSAFLVLLPSAASATTAILIEDGNCLPRSLRDKASGKNPIKITECEDLRLTAAGGVGVSGSEKHEYVLRGTCIRYDAWDSSPSKWVSLDTLEAGRAFATVSAKWENRTGTFTEQIKFQGGTSGSLSSKFKCASDPYLSNVNCTVMAHLNSTGWPSLSLRAYHCKMPFGKGKVNSQRAKSMSQSGGSQPPPPPVPKKPQKIDPGKVPLKQGLRPGSTLKTMPDLRRHSYRSLARPSADLCKQACRQDTRCRSWTYRKPARRGARGQCFLSERTVKPQRHPCCVSGVKRSRLRSIPRPR